MKMESASGSTPSPSEWETSYLGFFAEFNLGRFFEAHEVLEVLWLKVRGTPPADYYKGLIQLAGAFVHVQHERPGPAAALFRLAHKNLGRYQPVYEGLAIVPITDSIQEWLAFLDKTPLPPGLMSFRAPLRLPVPTLNDLPSQSWLRDTANQPPPPPEKSR